MNERNFPWLPEHIETLKTMWAENHTARGIADTLKTSRNSVIGKAHRLKLEKRSTGRVQVAPQKRKPEMRRPSRPSDRPLAAKYLFPVVSSPKPTEGPVGLFLRTGCAFPVKRTIEHLFCNAPCDGDYCDYHKSVMYRRPE